MKLQVTVVVTDGGIARVESTTLRLSPHKTGTLRVMAPEDIVANAARLVAQQAIYGRLPPTPQKDGGRG